MHEWKGTRYTYDWWNGGRDLAGIEQQAAVVALRVFGRRQTHQPREERLDEQVVDAMRERQRQEELGAFLVCHEEGVVDLLHVELEQRTLEARHVVGVGVGVGDLSREQPQHTCREELRWREALEQCRIGRHADGLEREARCVVLQRLQARRLRTVDGLVHSSTRVSDGNERMARRSRSSSRRTSRSAQAFSADASSLRHWKKCSSTSRPRRCPLALLPLSVLLWWWLSWLSLLVLVSVFAVSVLSGVGRRADRKPLPTRGERERSSKVWMRYIRSRNSEDRASPRWCASHGTAYNTIELQKRHWKRLTPCPDDVAELLWPSSWSSLVPASRSSHASLAASSKAEAVSSTDELEITRATASSTTKRKSIRARTTLYDSSACWKS